MNVMCHDIHDKYLAKKYCNEDAFFVILFVDRNEKVVPLQRR